MRAHAGGFMSEDTKIFVMGFISGIVLILSLLWMMADPL